MIDLSRYNLSDVERRELLRLLDHTGLDPTLRQIWTLMDAIWDSLRCNNASPDSESLSRYYQHPLWLLNGIFIEQHDLSMRQRVAIADSVSQLNPKVLADFGGGFGTLARLLAFRLPGSQIFVCEPYPSEHALVTCGQFSNINFIPSLVPQSVDLLVSTDVLEHVTEPLALLGEMVKSVRVGGYLIIANCFYPVIKCHLPSTFHLRYTFDFFCWCLGLDLMGVCNGTHGKIYRRSALPRVSPKAIAVAARFSRLVFPVLDACDEMTLRFKKALRPLRNNLRVARVFDAVRS